MRGAPWEEDGSGYRPTAYYHGGRKPQSLSFSSTEIGHLAIALAALTAAFTMFLGGYTWPSLGGPPGMRDGGLLENADLISESLAAEITAIHIVVISLLAVATGFLLHELSHKLVAQRYGLWAEFRASYIGLLVAVVVTFLTGIILAAPGAVIISGFVNRRENGIISAAGPGLNVGMAVLALPFLGVGPADTLGELVAKIVMLINGGLAIFNLLPFGPLDGKKVFRWNPLAYLLLAGLAVGAFAWPIASN